MIAGMARGLRRDRRCIAAVETALVLALLIAPILSLLVGGGQAMLVQYRVDRALHAGLMYGWGTATGATTTAANAAAQAGYGAANPVMTPTSSFACYCIDSAGTRSGQAAVACTATCSGGFVNAKYLTLSTSAGISPIMNMNWGSAAWTLSASATVRVPN